MGHDKEAARERARAIRCRLTPAEISSHSAAIRRHLLGVIDGADPVMVYASKPGEVDTSGLIERLLARGIRIVVPIIEQETRTLRLSFLRDPGVLRPSTFSVPEPVGCEIPADPSGIDLVVVPMMAFDRRGFRLGYGAGYYDRFLSDHPGMMKIGVAFSCLEVDRIPADEHDVRMDVIVTEDGVVEISPRES
ncbi:MAG: 5-formyltetrahydrofolate cyclo-ligase [Methanomicrobiales archaeon]|nr:5-formyltetrahydrofolate cyclo-ligase [Methanomicrobiales archaeon]